jgi:glycine cleavage system regulatory protein
MKCFLVVTVTCPDVPGVVERLTAAVVAHGGNWEESRLARLGGDFAGIVMVSAPAERAEALAAALVALTSKEMTVTVKRTSPKGADASAGHVLCWMRLEGADHEGIVHDVSAYLARQGINLESLETEIACAPMSATPLFWMEAQLDVPPRLMIDELRENLQQIADQLGVDIQVAGDRAEL